MLSFMASMLLDLLFFPLAHFDGAASSCIYTAPLMISLPAVFA
jgi:hypothetical protein